ncbi:hypothetical protein DID80_02995 [Candidatus Marinamargulisbacteria bacterium SCGC AAA071-K20]|nr:hypothetical protein DID80_02995 [Candidatus Marinamargulisbacteria bacterium SCGC AAA071-K20]
MIKYILSLIFISSVLVAQVNTESLRSSSKELGFSHHTGVNLQVLEGNSRLTTLKANYRLDYLGDVYSSFLITDIKYGHKSGSTYLNRGFVHARFLHPFKTQHVEFFSQREYDDFVDLKSRFLIGSGLRFSFFKLSKNKIFMGFGAMWELDDVVGQKESSFIRSTNYITSVIDKDNYEFKFTAYYQPLFSNFSDVRALLQQTLSVNLVKNVDFVTSLQYRYDSNPGNNIKPWDLELTNGFEVVF